MHPHQKNIAFVSLLIGRITTNKNHVCSKVVYNLNQLLSTAIIERIECIRVTPFSAKILAILPVYRS